jgi:hypothetical protein
MRDLPIYVAMGAFLLMGVGALARPTLVTAQFGMSELTAAGRNEVRAVYGGFGVLMAGVLVVALQRAELRGGILLTLACALGGMAAGRALSGLIDRRIDRWPLCYLLLEAVLAPLLLSAI